MVAGLCRIRLSTEADILGVILIIKTQAHRMRKVLAARQDDRGLDANHIATTSHGEIAKS